MFARALMAQDVLIDSCFLLLARTKQLRENHRQMSTRMLRLFTESDIGRGRSALPNALDYGLTDEVCFARMIALERKRTERSAKPFLLMLIEGRESLRPANGKQELFQKVLFAVRNSTRETDSMGWYKTDRTIGVIFTEVGAADETVTRAILAKITDGLRRHLTPPQMAILKISLHRYPEEGQRPQSLEDLVVFPDLPERHIRNKVGQIVKRAIDVGLSVLLLVLLCPLFLIIAIAIKVTSKGPVLFKQERVGQYGVPFIFLKFRSMYVNSDSRIHKEYVSRFISGEDGLKHQSTRDAGGVYKITRDPRVTRVGKLLRSSSLDELPQLLNVLKGEMSLVGPRPPIPYEFERYDIWHRRRVVEVKPGITGLWQVSGRSRTSFDEMVRLDLRYASSWSLGLDVKILMHTPRAVFSGDGAY